MLSTLPRKATGIACTFTLPTPGVDVAAPPHALSTNVAMVRTITRKRIFFMVCLSFFDWFDCRHLSSPDTLAQSALVATPGGGGSKGIKTLVLSSLRLLVIQKGTAS